MALVCFCSVVAPWAMLVSGFFQQASKFTVFFRCVLRVQRRQAAQLDNIFLNMNTIMDHHNMFK